MAGCTACLVLSGGALAASLTGVVAEGDIYDGERLVGASVWIDGVGTTSTSSDGLYLFEGLAAGDYTVHAVADGYLEGACARSVESSGEFWCSIALQVDPGGDDTAAVPDDTGGQPDDSDAPPDSGTPDSGLAGAFPPGSWEPLYGCGVAGGLPAALLALLGLAGAGQRRRRNPRLPDTKPVQPRSTP